jgi:hypothetical protein
MNILNIFMGRGKTLGQRARFNSYDCRRDRNNCSPKKCEEVNYTSQKAMEQRRQRDALIRMDPDLSKTLIYRREEERNPFHLNF